MREGSLISVVVVSALLFGAVEPWSIAVVGILTAFAFLSFAMSVKREDNAFAGSKALLVSMASVLIYPLFQMVPFPVSALDPVHREFRYLVTLVPGVPPAFHSISVYPFATEKEFSCLLIYCMIFSLAAFGTRHREEAFRLIKALTVFGFILALFAIVQHAAWNGKIYWFRQLTQGGTPFGPFVNRNHFAGFVGLIIPLTLGTAFRTRTAEKKVMYGFFGVVMAVSLFFSLSRGGIIAFFGGLFVFAFVSFTKGSSRKWLIPLFVFLLVLAVYLLFLGIGPVIERFAGAEVSHEHRLTAWRGALAAFRDFPLFGSGLGTFRYVFKIYQPEGLYLVWNHAHNDYLELLLEEGVVGAALTAFFLFIALRTILKAEWRGRNLYTGAAIIASIATLAIHSVVDFNLHIPSNAILFSLILGLGVAMSKEQVLGKGKGIGKGIEKYKYKYKEEEDNNKDFN